MTGLTPGLVGGLVEVDHAEHRAVIRDRHRRHVHLLDALHQLLDVAESIQQRVLGVYVEMGECHRDGRYVGVMAL